MKALQRFLERLLTRWSPVKPTINEQLVKWHRWNRGLFNPANNGARRENEPPTSV